MSDPHWTEKPNNTAKQLVPEEVHQRAQNQDLQEREAADDLSRKNHNFLQVQKRNLKEFRRLIDQSPVAAKLMFLLAERMNKQNAVMCSFNTLMDITGLSRSTLSKAVALLKKEMWIEVIKVGTANAYLINSQVFWQDSADKKYSHTVFTASIVASKSEQGPEYTENWKGVSLRHFPFLESAHESKEVDQDEQPKRKRRAQNPEAVSIQQELERMGQQRLIDDDET